MKKLLAIITLFCFVAGVAHAGCGKKVTSFGTLKKFDPDSKQLTLASVKPTKPITLTPTSKIANRAGKAAKIDKLVGKKVVVISEHDKADLVIAGTQIVIINDGKVELLTAPEEGAEKKS